MGLPTGPPPLAHLPPVLPPGPGQPPCGGAARLCLTLLPLRPAAGAPGAGGARRRSPQPVPPRQTVTTVNGRSKLPRASPQSRAPTSHLPCTPPRARAPTPQAAAAPLRGAAPASVSAEGAPGWGREAGGSAASRPPSPRASRSPSFFPRSPSSQRGGGGSGGRVTDREPGSGRPRALPSSPLARRGRWRRKEKA